jgi:hypothetical protein
MIGIWQSYSDIYLYVACAAMLAGFGVPLVFAPMQWARAFRWPVTQADNLSVFLARSLGVFICLLAVFAAKVTAAPQAKPFFFELLIWLFGAMIALHVYGAIRKTQPITETIEIALWIVLLLVTLLFYPA